MLQLAGSVFLLGLVLGCMGAIRLALRQTSVVQAANLSTSNVRCVCSGFLQRASAER